MNKLEKELCKALRKLLNAIAEAEENGCIDHLDCADDGGEFFSDAVEQANAALSNAGYSEDEP